MYVTQPRNSDTSHPLDSLLNSLPAKLTSPLHNTPKASDPGGKIKRICEATRKNSARWLESENV